MILLSHSLNRKRLWTVSVQHAFVGGKFILTVFIWVKNGINKFSLGWFWCVNYDGIDFYGTIVKKMFYDNMYMGSYEWKSEIW